MYPLDCIFLYNEIFTTDECDHIINVSNKHAVIYREVYEPTKMLSKL